jgi:predicted phosphodiesterase
VRLGGRTIYVLHDLQELQLDPALCGVDVVVSGHSHQLETVNGVLYLDPGRPVRGALSCLSHWPL